MLMYVVYVIWVFLWCRLQLMNFTTVTSVASELSEQIGTLTRVRTGTFLLVGRLFARAYLQKLRLGAVLRFYRLKRTDHICANSLISIVSEDTECWVAKNLSAPNAPFPARFLSDIRTRWASASFAKRKHRKQLQLNWSDWQLLNRTAAFASSEHQKRRCALNVNWFCFSRILIYKLSTISRSTLM